MHLQGSARFVGNPVLMPLHDCWFLEGRSRHRSGIHFFQRAHLREDYPHSILGAGTSKEPGPVFFFIPTFGCSVVGAASELVYIKQSIN